MRIFRYVFVASLMNVGNYVLAQPVATDFSLPVQPVSDYYDAGPFLSLNKGKYHMGEDWNGNEKGSSDYGDPVYPMAVGKVVKAFDQKGSIGKVVVIKHLLPDGQVIYSYYFHLSKILVSVNQIVSSDKPLGQIGDANGFYKGNAHLHFELRRVNQSTNSSYYPTLTIATARKYLHPSRFIDDRANKVTMNLRANTWFRSKNEGIEILDYTTAALSYVTCGGETMSLLSAVEAGWIDPSIWTDRSAMDGGYDHWEDSIVFGPDINFRIKAFQNCTLTIVIPGYNFQAERARDDMIKVAGRAGFTRVKLGTLSNLGTDGTGFYDLRSLCFDNGANTGVGCLVQATSYDDPLLRYVIWYEPATNEEIGEWTELDPDDID